MRQSYRLMIIFINDQQISKHPQHLPTFTHYHHHQLPYPHRQMHHISFWMMKSFGANTIYSHHLPQLLTQHQTHQKNVLEKYTVSVIPPTPQNNSKTCMRHLSPPPAMSMTAKLIFSSYPPLSTIRTSSSCMIMTPNLFILFLFPPAQNSKSFALIKAVTTY